MKKKSLVWVLTLVMLASLLVLPAGAAGKTFPDAQGHWAEGSIQRWSDCGLVNGDEVGNVNPNKYLRRCELAKMLADMLGLRTAAPISTFRDIRGDEWYANAVLRCAAAGIMEGSFSNCYPEDPVTREEAIVMFSRALGVQPSEDPDLSQFSDSDRVSDWAAPYLATLLDLGILSGMGDDILAPKASMNRAGAFTLMDKAISVYANAPGSYVASDPDRFVVVNAALHDGGEVKITGQAAGVLVATGASNEITLQDLTTSKVLVNGKSSVTATGTSKLGLVEMNGAASFAVDSKAAVTGLTVNTDKAAVTNRGTIATLTCVEAAAVTNSGTVEKLVAEDAATVTNTGKIEMLVANAALRVDNKKGTIQQAEINQSGVILDGTPRQMVLADGVTRPTSSTGRPVTVAGGSSGGSSSGGGGGPSTPVAVTGVAVSPVGWVMNEKETKALSATVTPSNASNKQVAWSSSDAAVASVSAGGVVTANAVGTATITATTADGGKTAACSVTVRPEGSDEPIAVEGVRLNKTTLALEEGDSETLTASADPENGAGEKVVRWESGDDSIARVDAATGRVTAVAPGTTTITATLTVTTTVEPTPEPDPETPTDPEQGGGEDQPAAQADEPTTKVETFTATCAVTVTMRTVKVTGVTLDKTGLRLKLGQTATATLTATVAPANATNQTVTWTSSNGEVATISDGVVTAMAPGEATITVTTADGGKTAQCRVTVEAADIVVTGITLDKTLLTMTVGEPAVPLIATVAPAEATNRAVTWTSSDETVATVTADGVVAAVAPGEATITATTADGGHTATCAITVFRISLDAQALDLVISETCQLTATVLPENSGRTVTWTSDNGAVDVADGLVTARQAGSALVTAAIEGTNIKAECVVKVAERMTVEVLVEKESVAVGEAYRIDTGTAVSLMGWLALELEEGQTATIKQIASTTSTEVAKLLNEQTGQVLIRDIGKANVTVEISTPGTDGGEPTTETVVFTITITKKNVSEPAS